MARGIAPHTPARDVKLAGSGRITGGARKSASTRAQLTQALVALAQRGKVGALGGAVMPMGEPDADEHGGPSDNDADDMPMGPGPVLKRK